MYFLLYGTFYLLSLLPFSILYFISDGLYRLAYYVVGYRKNVVMSNLRVAFPEKTEKERKRIAREFYRNLMDAIVETIKLFSISEKELNKRCSGDFALINELAAKGKNIQLQPPHQFNVEYYNLLYSQQLKQLNFIFMYMPFSGDNLNRVFKKLRTQYGSKLISATNFQKEREILKEGQYAITLGADQNPGNVKDAMWMNFFNEAAPFIPGPAKVAVKNNYAIVFVEFIKVKRGYYKFENTLIAENSAELNPEELTKKYRDLVEGAIKRQPSNYLWTHKRWKHRIKREDMGMWVETN
jgi:Kdo2-lipid IVA lauroyltransferase/acyltransferase